jgi:hypothetical protein
MASMAFRSSELVSTLDRTIEDLGYDFRGDGAFSFATEADVQAALLGRLRGNVLFNVRDGDVKTELVHAEFPAFGVSWEGAARHDLVVWRPDSVRDARDKWGTPPRQWPEALRRSVNLVAVEIERFAGLPWGIRQYQMFSEDAPSVVEKKVRENDDVRKLAQSWCEYRYFLMFWDEDEQTEKKDLGLFEKHLSAACARISVKCPLYGSTAAPSMVVS